jgi:hypothetical protein
MISNYAYTNKEKILEGIFNILSKSDFKAFANQTLTVTGTVASLTVPDGAKYALVSVESTAIGIAIRYWLDGTAPTGTEGIGREDGTGFDIVSTANLKQFKVIQAQAGTHKLQVQYFY